LRPEEQGQAASPHQAPTLIGCKFLKIASQARRPTTYYPAFPASLRQQQRNEIMKTAGLSVNRFFTSLNLSGTTTAARALTPLGASRLPALSWKARKTGILVTTARSCKRFFSSRKYRTDLALAVTPVHPDDGPTSARRPREAAPHVA
ncbi:hypothetical protein, partial [Paraburkholderia dinghuensis]|uniref:hypothetical protein n=1 Tax=Paraburkholderia dinghuensis TaxID=2305225 RepID=UPI001C874C83